MPKYTTVQVIELYDLTYEQVCDWLGEEVPLGAVWEVDLTTIVPASYIN